MMNTAGSMDSVQPLPVSLFGFTMPKATRGRTLSAGFWSFGLAYWIVLTCGSLFMASQMHQENKPQHEQGNYQSHVQAQANKDGDGREGFLSDLAQSHNLLPLLILVLACGLFTITSFKTRTSGDVFIRLRPLFAAFAVGSLLVLYEWSNLPQAESPIPADATGALTITAIFIGLFILTFILERGRKRIALKQQRSLQ